MCRKRISGGYNVNDTLEAYPLLLDQFKGSEANDSPTTRLGELLVSAGILRADRLPEALQVSKNTGSPIGRVLVMLSCVDQADVDSALEVQRMIRGSQITPDFGVQALQDASGRKAPVFEILQTYGNRKEYVIRNPLGDLLVEAELLTRQQLTEAIRISAVSGMPLGKHLSITGIISTPVLFESLNAQIEMRDGKINREQAIARIKEAAIQRKAISRSVAGRNSGGQNTQKSEIKFGELLCMADVISEADVLSAIEIGLFRNQPIGQVLVDSHLIPNFLIGKAIELQNMVKRADLRPTQAAQALMLVNKEQCSVQEALRQLGLDKKRLDGWKEALELLQVAGLVGETRVRALIRLAESSDGEEVKAILDSNLIDELLFQSAVRCHNLLQTRKLRRDQAIIALHYCQRSRTSLDQALTDLSYTTQ